MEAEDLGLSRPTLGRTRNFSGAVVFIYGRIGQLVIKMKLGSPYFEGDVRGRYVCDRQAAMQLLIVGHEDEHVIRLNAQKTGWRWIS